MYHARYIATDGSAGEDVALPTSLFDGVVHEAALHQAVTAHLANRRQGTAHRRNRSAVTGGSRKPWRQKGTGRARQGTIRAAQWRGGGLAFPPQTKSWTRRVPRRIRALARRSAFSSRAAEGRIVVIEGFDFEAPRTKRLVKLLASIEPDGKTLLLTHGVNRALYLSGRNLAGVRVLPFGQEAPYDVIWAGTVVIEEAALARIGDAPAGDVRERRRPIRVRSGSADDPASGDPPEAPTVGAAPSPPTEPVASSDAAEDAA